MTDDAVILIENGAGSRRVRLGDYLSLDEIEQADREALAWIKGVRQADLEGRPLRDRLTYRGDSLWWFVELYLHRMRVIEALCRAVTASENLFAREHPGRVEVVDGDAIARVVIAIGARRHGANVTGTMPGWWHDAGGLLRVAARGLALSVGALASRLRTRRRDCPAPGEGVRIAAFVHSAFWRSTADREAYVGPTLRALAEAVSPGDLVYVGLGPRTVFRARTLAKHVQDWQDDPAHVAAIELYARLPDIGASLHYALGCNRVRRWLWRSPDLRRAAIIRGYDLWRFIRHELAGVAYLQLPWSTRAMDEIAAALDCLKPAVALTYAEAGGWGRALVLEARRRRIPTVGLQHGFIHRHWLNYRHEADEVTRSAGNNRDTGFPFPTATLLFDRFAAAHLQTAGALPPDALVVTGNPRLDALAAAVAAQDDAARQATRTRLGVADGARLVVLATKYRERAHASLAALFDAIRGQSGAHLAVRCHPAETADPYRRMAGDAANISIAPADIDLASTLAVADLVVTVNSTVALEGMALGVPALALNLPNYLSPFVEAGVMLGAASPADVGPALLPFLQDEAARDALRARQRAFMAEYGMLPTGQAAPGAVRAVLDLARRTGRVLD